VTSSAIHVDENLSSQLFERIISVRWYLQTQQVRRGTDSNIVFKIESKSYDASGWNFILYSRE
jgi:hypothetical protein